jgi:hypothetical protein
MRPCDLVVGCDSSGSGVTRWNASRAAAACCVRQLAAAACDGAALCLGGDRLTQAS